MIFVTVGTTDFDPLVEAMDRIASIISEPVIAQTGRGAFVPQHLEHFPFAPSLEPFFRQARIVVSHGGIATLIEVLRMGRPLVAASNPDRYDLHQEDILRAFSERNYLVWCHDLSDLSTALAETGLRRFSPYAEPSCEIATVIRRYLRMDEPAAEKRRTGTARVS
jgi:UDP-N-acetylglucosamine transferase subunit ALG13